MNIIGIDYSLNGTGLSIFNGTSVTFSKIFTTKPKIAKEFPNDYIVIPEFDKQTSKMDWVCDTILSCKDYDYVCMEDHIGSYYDWMDGYAILKHYFRKHNIPYICVAPAQVKKYAGNGKADKTQMSYFLRQDYKLDFDYLGDGANNVVDATWLAVLGHNFFRLKQGEKITQSKERMEILKKLMKKF